MPTILDKGWHRPLDPHIPTRQIPKSPTPKYWSATVKGLVLNGKYAAKSITTSPGVIPVNTILPAFVDTTPEVGDVIGDASCSTGTWTGTPTPTYAKQYKKNGSNISIPYTVVIGDVGATFSCVVTATNAAGSVQASSVSTSAVPQPLAAPVNTVLPAWTDTTPEIGDTITSTSCSTGTWTGNPAPSYSKQYRKNGANISVPYTIVSGDYQATFDCIVTATNSQGSPTATSAATSAVPGIAPSNTALPTWTDTTPEVGDTITSTSCSNGSWNGVPSPSFSKQYRKNGSNITVPYTVVSGDVGATFDCVVTATNAVSSAQATSAATSAVTNPASAPVNTVLPAWADTTPVVGDTITSTSCDNGTWTGNPTPTFSKQYRKNGVNITVPYTVVEADAQLTFDCVVTATNASGSPTATSAATEKVPGLRRKGTSVGGSTITLPSHVSGDWIFVGAYKDTDANAYTTPSGWTLVRAGNGGTNNMTVYGKQAASSSETFTISGANHIIAAVYDGCAGFGGVNATTSASSTNVGYGAPSTWTRADTTSKLIWFAGHASIDTNLQNPPTGATNIVNDVNAVNEVSLMESNSYLNAYTGNAVSVGGTAASYSTVVVEVMKS